MSIQRTVRKIDAKRFEVDYTRTVEVNQPELKKQIEELKALIQKKEAETGLPQIRKELQSLEDLLADLKKAK